MTTVMSWGDSEGTHGRCDAKCHTASVGPCECMCGGRFHGKALTPGALERELLEAGEEVLEGARARAAAAGLQLQAGSVASILQQLQLEHAQGELFVRDGVCFRSPTWARRHGL